MLGANRKCVNRRYGKRPVRIRLYQVILAVLIVLVGNVFGDEIRRPAESASDESASRTDSLGRCCYGCPFILDIYCDDITEDSCAYFGGKWVGGVNCYDDPCPMYHPCDIPGNADGLDGVVNLIDVTYIISYLYRGGPPPEAFAICNGDADCNCTVNLLDVTYIVDYLYRNGDAPCDPYYWCDKCYPPM